MKNKHVSAAENSIIGEIYSSVTQTFFLSSISDDLECRVIYLCHQTVLKFGISNHISCQEGMHPDFRAMFISDKTFNLLNKDFNLSDI